MELITEVIGTQNFELVRRQIAAIVLLELTNQIKLQSLEDRIDVFEERGTPISKEEDIVITISFDTANYTKVRQGSMRGDTTYMIDVYANASSTLNQNGYLSSANKIQKYMGMLLYILSSTKYNRLGLAPGLIGGTVVETINMYQIGNQQDAAHMQMGRMTFNAKLCENQELWKGVTLLSHVTKIKLSNSTQGYQLKL